MAKYARDFHMKKKAVFIYSDDLLTYKFHNQHPFNQFRITLTIDLLQSIDALTEEHIIPPRIATEKELTLIHDPSYIQAVKKAGEGQLSPDIAEGYGLGTEDTPIFKGMHEASALLVGGTLTAVIGS